MLLQYLEETGKKLPHLEKVIIGGAACPRAMTEAFERDYDVEVIHAWGMTEMSPLGSLCTRSSRNMVTPPATALFDVKQKQGHAPFGIEMKIVDDDEQRDAVGRQDLRPPQGARPRRRLRLLQAAPAPNSSTMRAGSTPATSPHIDPFGYMQITDRSKDVIKSGGEWISSIDLENLAVGHPDVAEAAVIGLPHPKWDERPLLVVVPREGRKPSKDDILAFMEGKIAKWWMPDDVAFVDEIPHTATGKIQKTALRDQFAGYQLTG